MDSKPTILTNLCLIRKGDQILLAMKKRGFGVGRWNGYGGKVVPPETIEECLIREVEEESGLKISDFHKIGFLRFENVDRFVEMYIYETHSFAGELIETEEMAPKWFILPNLPFEEMWTSDALWYPLYLEGKQFIGEVIFDQNHQVVSSDIKEVANL